MAEEQIAQEEPTFLGPVAELPVLAENFRAAGIRTLAVVNNPYLDAAFGMARGFDVYDFDVDVSEESYRPAAATVDRALAARGRRG